MKSTKDLNEYLKEKEEILKKISNPAQVQKRAKEIYGSNAEILISPRIDKKYRILNPKTEKYIDFGSYRPPMEDFTFHRDEKRRQNYLKRSEAIKGNWKSDPYSGNNLSRRLLWNL